MNTATLRIRRKMIGWKICELADRVGVSEPTMKRHLADPDQLTREELRKMTDELQLTPADVWTIVTGRELTIRELQQMTV